MSSSFLKYGQVLKDFPFTNKIKKEFIKELIQGMIILDGILAHVFNLEKRK